MLLQGFRRNDFYNLVMKAKNKIGQTISIISYTSFVLEFKVKCNATIFEGNDSNERNTTFNALSEAKDDSDAHEQIIVLVLN